MPISRPERRSLIFFMALAAACGGSGESGPGGAAWTAEIDTVGDTITVRTVSGSVWGDTAQLVAEVSIGMFEGPDEYMLGNVRSLAVGPGGEIYLLDSHVPALRKYAPDGTHLATFGREGGGPGEYKSPDGGLAVLADGRIVLRDPGNMRFAVYAPDGEYLDSWRISGGFNTSRRLYRDGASSVYTMVLLEVGKVPWEWTYGLARYTAEGEHHDTVIAPTWDFEPSQVTAQREGSSSSRTVPFTGAVDWAFSPLGYFVGGVSTDYRVDLYRVAEPVLRIEREWVPAPVASEEAEEQERNIRESFRRNYGSWRWNGPPIPGTKPAFTNIHVDDDGRIWVQTSQEGRPVISQEQAREDEESSGRPVMRYREPVAFDVFDPDGRFLGHVRTPAGFAMNPEPTARGDYVWAVRRDDLDVAYVVRYRITFPSAA